MALPPFSKDIDRLFRGGKHVGLKMLAGAFVGAFFGFMASAEFIQSSPVVATVVVCGATVLGLMTAFGLSMRDLVESQRKAGEPVSRVTKILFGSHFLSLAAWCVIVVIAIMLGLFIFAVATKP